MPARARQARMARATIVSVGPYPVDVGNTDESVHSRFSTSWNRCHGSTTLVARVGAHAAGADDVLRVRCGLDRDPARTGERWRRRGEREARAGALHDLGQLRSVVLRRDELVAVRRVRDPSRREAAPVAHLRIEIDAVRRLREVFALDREGPQPVAHRRLEHPLRVHRTGREVAALHHRTAAAAVLGQAAAEVGKAVVLRELRCSRGRGSCDRRGCA